MPNMMYSVHKHTSNSNSQCSAMTNAGLSVTCSQIMGTPF